MENIHLLHIWGGHSDHDYKVIMNALWHRTEQESAGWRGKCTKRDLKIRYDHCEQLYAKNLENEMKDNLLDVK